jgi:hypothetical protein
MQANLIDVHTSFKEVPHKAEKQNAGIHELSAFDPRHYSQDRVIK